MTKEKPNPFTIIRYRGEPQKAEFEGVPIAREDKLFVPEWGGLVSCAPYDDHFVFEVPPGRKRAGMSDYLCTCGSAAVVAKPETQTGRLFVCLFHATYGYHSTSVVNKKDFDRKEIGDIDTASKKWLI